MIKPNLSLVGKFFTIETPPSVDEAEQILQKKWNLSQGVTVKPMKEDKILFAFNDKKDKNKVIYDGPWNVNGVLLVLKEWSEGQTLSDIDFSVACFWVKIQGLPLLHYTLGEASDISRSIGNPISLELNFRERRFRTRVEIDLNYPLKSGFVLPFPCHGDRFIQFKYEGLGDFCYRCGKLNHTQKACNEIPAERITSTGKIIPLYGPWLNADIVSDESIRVILTDKFQETEDDDTLPYAQFFIELNVYVTYYEKGSEVPTRTIRDHMVEHNFRFPCSSVTTSNDASEAYSIVTGTIAEHVPFPLDKLQWRAEHLQPGFSLDVEVDLMKNLSCFLRYMERKECDSGRKWFPISLKIEKQVILPYVDFETMIHDRSEDELNRKIEKTISNLIKAEVARDAHLLSLTNWKKKIQEVLKEIGVTVLPFNLEERAARARAEAVELEIFWANRPKPANQSAVLKLETVKVRGADLDLLDPCVICMEDLLLGCGATRMPCSHVFHKLCIEEWLRAGHTCPLCCFQLPT